VHEAIRLLMDEHRIIEQVLGSFETLGQEIRGGLAVERPLLGEYTDFLRSYADSRHHMKEEDVLFARMVERGFSRQFGPIAAMLEEHRQGRFHVTALSGLAEAPGPLSEAERTQLVAIAGGFVGLLRQHIQKEDRILYPMALSELSPADLDQVNSQFAETERRLRDDGTHDRQSALVERLVTRFRPDPQRMANAVMSGGCFAG